MTKGSLSCATVALAVAAGLTLAPGRAEARFVDLHVGARAGGITGWGTTSNTPDFFDHTKGGGVGFELGLKLLIFDLSANFLQVVDSSGAVGTLTQFLLGTEVDVPLGRPTLWTGQSRNILRPGFGVGFGFGTPGPVSPPLDAAQISHKGVVAQFKVAYEYFLNPFMGLGFEGDVGYHYFLDGRVISAMNNLDHSSGYHLIGLGTVTFHLGY
jgi:hypothetical protein